MVGREWANSLSGCIGIQGAGVSGKAGKDLSVSVGWGGVVRMNDLKERTGRSIPSRDVEELFLSLK